jgi:hypothetical protein
MPTRSADKIKKIPNSGSPTNTTKRERERKKEGEERAENPRR